MLFETEVLGEQVLHHVRRLRALIDGQALLAGIPVGDDGARLVGDAGMAAEHECRLDHRVRLGKTLVGIAGIERALEGEIVAERGMDHRRRRIERGFGVGDGGQRLVVDVDQRAGVFGFGARARDHGAHRFALPAGALDGDGVLRRRFDALEMREHADPRRDHLGKLGAGDDRDHARRFLRRRGVDAFDARMRVRRAHEGDVRHARQHDVADILAAPLRQPRQIRPRHRAADIGIRPVERGEAGRLVGGDFHRGRCYNPLIPAQAGIQRIRFDAAFFVLHALASRRNGTLYVGMTDNLARRVWEHQSRRRSRLLPRRYGVKTLVWYELHDSRESAFQRERQLKKWNRAWKIELVEQARIQVGAISKATSCKALDSRFRGNERFVRASSQKPRRPHHRAPHVRRRASCRSRGLPSAA